MRQIDPIFALTLWIVLAVIVAGISDYLARAKGHRGAVWVLLSFIFWPLALIGAALLPNRKTELLMRQQVALQKGIVDDQLEKELLSAGLRKPTEEEKRASNVYAWKIVAIIALIFVLFMLRGFSQ